MQIGDTFVWCPGVGIDHLWILISEPSQIEGKCVLVNLTESLRGKYSFILKPGQHPYIYKDSDVAFGDAIRTTKAELEKQVHLGMAKPHEPMRSDIWKSIILEAHKHPAFPPHLRKLLPPP